MTIMKEAIDKEDWERMQEGLPPRPKPEMVYVEPTPPVVPNELKDIPAGEIVDILARRHTLKNKDGVMFCGYDVSVKVGDRFFEGWLPEGEFFQLKKRIPPERIDLLNKIGW